MTNGDVSDTGGVARNVENHGSENDGRKRRVESHTVVGERAAGAQREVVEGDGGEHKSGRHAGDRPAGNTTTARTVDNGERDEGEDEAVQRGWSASATRGHPSAGSLGDGDDESDDKRVLESHASEQRGGIVDEGVETVWKNVS